MTNSNLTLGQILEAFPQECKTIAPREYRRLKKSVRWYYVQMDRIDKHWASLPEKRIMMGILEINAPKEKFEQIANLGKLMRISNKTPEEIKRGIGQEEIESARARRLYDLHTWETKGRVNPEKFIAICPFHNEKTGSLSVRGNKFHCFGCGAKGDAIDFVQKLNGFSFIEAVKYLFSQ